MSRALRASLVWLSAAWASIPAWAQDAWDDSPYRIQVYVVAWPNSQVSAARLEGVAQHLRDRADTVIGGAWRLDASLATPELAVALTGNWDALRGEQLPRPDKPTEKPPDKVVLLRASVDANRGQIEAREFDWRTQQWDSHVVRDVHQPARLEREAFLTLVEAFAPLGRIEQVESKQATVRLRAGYYEPRDPRWSWTRPGDVFRAFLRVNERDGTARSLAEVPWTVLEVEGVEGAKATCHVESGVRGALAVPSRGRVEQLALGVRAEQGSTRLELLARTPDARPLAGYDIYAADRTAATPARLGRSDRRGGLAITPGPGPYRILLVRNGQELLARLPIIPGLVPTATARITDDTQRLEVEGFAVGLQESVVDLVARRAVLLARAEARLDENQLDEASKLIDELRRMETREQLRQRILAERRRFASEDPVVQRKIDRLFNDTVELLARYLDPKDIESLANRLRTARTASASRAN